MRSFSPGPEGEQAFYVASSLLPNASASAFLFLVESAHGRKT